MPQSIPNLTVRISAAVPRCNCLAVFMWWQGHHHWAGLPLQLASNGFPAGCCDWSPFDPQSIHETGQSTQTWVSVCDSMLQYVTVCCSKSSLCMFIYIYIYIYTYIYRYIQGQGTHQRQPPGMRGSIEHQIRGDFDARYRWSCSKSPHAALGNKVAEQTKTLWNSHASR